MGKSLILAIDELAQGQTQAFQTVNDMLAAIEEATNRPLEVDLSSPDADYVVAELDAVRYVNYIFSNPTTDRLVTFPSTVNTNTTNRLLWVTNQSDTYNLTVDAGGVSTVVVKPGSAAAIMIIGDAVSDLIGKSLSSIPHTVAFFTAGVPTPGNETLRYSFAEAVEWPGNLVGSDGSVAVPPASLTGFFIYQNGVKCGDVLIDSTGAFTFTSTGGDPVEWAVGDVLTVKYIPVEYGQISFSAKADNGDTVTINDGAGSHVYTFGSSGGQVATGSTATNSATNLNNSIIANQASSIRTIYTGGTVIKIINLLEAGGGSITKSDADNDYTITNFATETSAATFGVTFLGSRV